MWRSKSLLTEPNLKIKKWFFRKRYYLSIVGVVVAVFFAYKESVVILSEPVSSWTQDFAADCAVVLTGGGSRVKEGFDLLSRSQVKKLIIAGTNPESNLREIMPYWTFYPNLKQEDVILEKRSQTTFGNAQQTLPIVEALKCRDIILVTSRVHMYRSYRTFKSIYPDEIIILKDSIISGSYQPELVELMTEVLKSIFYSTWAY